MEETIQSGAAELPADVQITGWRVWLTGGLRYNSAEHTLLDIPGDGMLIALVYFNRWTDAGVAYRMTGMGSDWYFVNPATGVVGHNDDGPESIRARYGAETLVWRGMWTSAAELDAVRDEAMAAVEVPQ